MSTFLNLYRGDRAGMYKLVGSDYYNIQRYGAHRVRPTVPWKVKKGDVMGFHSSGSTAIPFRRGTCGYREYPPITAYPLIGRKVKVNSGNIFHVMGKQCQEYSISVYVRNTCKL